MRHQKEGNHSRRSASAHIKPQPSSFAMDEDPVKMSSTSVRTTTEAFKVVGSVLHFSSFSVDKLGQPLVNESPQHTDGWEVPIYQQIFNQVIGIDGQDIEVKEKRPKSMCFNCGSSAHQMRDCPKPKDLAAISERRKEFNQYQNHAGLGNQRYHADEVEERFSKYKPGILSEELLSALGLDGNTLPPLIYRMRKLGYPPGWLKEAEMEKSGLTLYDGNVSNDNSMSSPQNVSYDISKLVDFPGFNVPVPHKVKDEFMRYSSIPIQSNHLKHNYAAYLSSHFASSDSPSSKRPLESDSSQHIMKKHRSSYESDSDMDIESDPGTPYRSCRQGNSHFQPPLPVGSPSFSSPPPQCTPPATPTPPPRTPTNGSPATRGHEWVVVDDAVEGTEDELTLEELEEQQRLIWAALQNADTANSNTVTSTAGTPTGQSANLSAPIQDDSEMENLEVGGYTDENPIPHGEISHNDGTLSPPASREGDVSNADDVLPATSKQGSAQSPAAPESKVDCPQRPCPKEFPEHPRSPGPIESQDESPQSPALLESQEDSLRYPNKVQEDCPQSPNQDSLNVNAANPKVLAVPHRSRFAEGIVPFEETPEYTEVAEAKGTYLRIRDLLKSSPRNLNKKKND
ncbi:zinc finger CCHC domain-containing protein 8 isoform X2 [Corythoichthys intestinalis]|nr:zinc finger CCHC domain-containing protein 8 isoform X2 [Corythoichthys intestinalis]